MRQDTENGFNFQDIARFGLKLGDLVVNQYSGLHGQIYISGTGFACVKSVAGSRVFRLVWDRNWVKEAA